MFMTLCHTLVGYLISFVYISSNCVFLREEAELPTRPPPPSLEQTHNLLTWHASDPPTRSLSSCISLLNVPEAVYSFTLKNCLIFIQGGGYFRYLMYILHKPVFIKIMLFYEFCSFVYNIKFLENPNFMDNAQVTRKMCNNMTYR